MALQFKTTEAAHAGLRFTRLPLMAWLAAGVSLTALSGAQAQDPAGAVELDTITVTGTQETGDGPVDGYVATRSRAGTKTDTPLSRTPQSVSVVPREEIEDRDAGSVAEALRYSAGMTTEYRGSSNFHDEMFIRGFGYVPRYVNGLTYGSSSLGQIDPYLLERVEVLRGPSSILYGQASPGGIVNLVTKRANGDTRREVELTTGDNAKLGAAFDFQGTLDDAAVWSYRLVGKAERFDLQEDLLSREGVLIAPSLRWAPDADTALTLSAFYNYEPKAGFRNFRVAAGTLYPGALGYIPRDFTVTDPSNEVSERTQAQIGYTFEHRFNDTFQVRQNAAFNHIDHAHKTLTWGNLLADGRTITRRASGGGNILNQATVDNQLQSDFDTGVFRHTLLTGIDFKHTTEDYNWGFGDAPDIDWTAPVYGIPDIPLVDNLSDRVTTGWQLGAYVQDQIEIGKLTMSFGGRYDWARTAIDDNLGSDLTYFDSAFSGRAGAIYNFDNGISPFASYSTSFEPIFGRDSAGEAFDPTTGQQLEAGVKYAPANGRYQVVASVFEIYQQNVTSTDPVLNTTFQTGEIRNMGFEIEGHAEVTDNLSLSGSYTFLEARISKSDDPAAVGRKPRMIPKHSASLWGRYLFDDGAFNGLGLGLGVRYIGDTRDWNNATTVPHATLFDAMASYDFGAISDEFAGAKLQINATNLLDKRYVSACASVGACWYGQSRTISASLKYSW